MVNIVLTRGQRKYREMFNKPNNVRLSVTTVQMHFIFYIPKYYFSLVTLAIICFLFFFSLHKLFSRSCLFLCFVVPLLLFFCLLKWRELLKVCFIIFLWLPLKVTSIVKIFFIFVFVFLLLLFFLFFLFFILLQT